MDDLDALKQLVRDGDPRFWEAAGAAATRASGFDEILFLARLAREAKKLAIRPAGTPLRLAVLGGSSLYPLHEAIELALVAAGFAPTLFVGEYDNYQAEIRDPASALHRFRPEVVVLFPSAARARYSGDLTDSREAQRGEAEAVVGEILGLCEVLHAKTDAEILLGNFLLPAGLDPGPFRTRTLGSEWSFKKLVNLELGLRAPSFVQICDVELLGCRRGLVAAHDPRGWFETKQPYALDLQLDVAREVAQLARSLRRATAKVLALDLDNTLWGGVIGDDGLDGIEIGDTSPRGEAFKAFQKHVLELSRRGVLLAVCSKNDRDKAMEPFEKHPEMVLRPQHFSAFYASWGPKSESLRAIANDLNLGLDSLVFVDDNPAEIEVVRQFAPEVRTLLLGPDPSTYVRALADARFFEPRSVTSEDRARGAQYAQERQRKALLDTVTDMPTYLASLAMTAEVKPFTAIDAPRITQLINKSNQFNLTTVRRTEAEIDRLVADGGPSFVVRLADRFGEHGLIAVVIATPGGGDLVVDTWVMSCRVLERQVEEEVANELFRAAAALGLSRVVGRYRPTAKNDLVRELYARLGFAAVGAEGDTRIFARAVADFEPFATKIAVVRGGA